LREYDNRPGHEDHVLLGNINRVRKTGENLIAGVVIDKNRVTVLSENQGVAPHAFPRCGY
jgi:hypothetical protein